MAIPVPDDAVDRLGRSADRPSVAAGLVAATATAFSAVWFALVGAEGPLVGVLFSATVANASVVTYVGWRWLVPEGTWSYRRGLATGLAVGVGSHLAIGYAWLLAVSLFDPGRVAHQTVRESLFMGLILDVYSVPFTLGIPVLLSVAVALGLTYSRRRVPATHGK